jgi:hypothetical protein
LFSCRKESAETSGVAEVNKRIMDEIKLTPKEKHQDSFDVDGRNNPRSDNEPLEKLLPLRPDTNYLL